MDRMCLCSQNIFCFSLAKRALQHILLHFGPTHAAILEHFRLQDRFPMLFSCLPPRPWGHGGKEERLGSGSNMQRRQKIFFPFSLSSSDVLIVWAHFFPSALFDSPPHAIVALFYFHGKNQVGSFFLQLLSPHEKKPAKGIFSFL